jgi:hypothetical protein
VRAGRGPPAPPPVRAANCQPGGRRGAARASAPLVGPSVDGPSDHAGAVGVVEAGHVDGKAVEARLDDLVARAPHGLHVGRNPPLGGGHCEAAWGAWCVCVCV